MGWAVQEGFLEAVASSRAAPTPDWVLLLWREAGPRSSLEAQRW